MNDAPPRDAGSAAARLLEREKRIAALESGQDLLLEGAAPGECLACLHGPLRADSARVGLVVVPGGDHALCMASRAPGLPVSALVVRPDSSEQDRRDLGIALQKRTVQLLLVTPDRIGQPRFVQFVRGLSLAYVAVTSCERILEGPHYCAPYEACRTLRGLFPGVPLLGLADVALDARERLLIAGALGMPPVVAAPAPMVSYAPATPLPTVQAAPPLRETPAERPVPVEAVKAPVFPARSRVIPESHRAAFPLFEKEMPIAEAAQQLGRELPWVWQALESFIRFTGRTHPFPWVSKPIYMTVSMAAGQTDTANPRLIVSVLRGQVEEGPILMVLAALENRNHPG